MVAGDGTQWYADAGEGNDSLSIAGANERTTVLGGIGNDTLQIGSMSKTVLAGSGNDSIVAGTAISTTCACRCR